MALTVNSNPASINAQNKLGMASGGLKTSMERLASGLRINSAKDDAAGLQISNRLTSQINGLNVAVRNANDGISMAQTAEGALQESTNILQRMRDLSVQASNATNTTVDRKALQEEVVQLKSELNRIAETTTFGGQNLLNGSFGSQNFQVGADANQTIGLAINSAQTDDLGSARTNIDAGSANGVAFAAADVAAAETAGAYTAGNITLNGTSGTDVAVAVAAGDSAADIQSKINAEFNATGVRADAKTTAYIDSFVGGEVSAAGVGDGISFKLGTSLDTAGTAIGDAVTISFTSSGDAASDLQTLANKINENAAVTGISAKFTSNVPSTASGAGLVLTSESGDTIRMSDYTDDNASGGGTASSFNIEGADYDGTAQGTADAVTSGGDDAALVKGTIQLDSTIGFSVNTANATFGAGALQQSSEISVDTVNLTTAQGAQDAISVIDGALAKIDRNRSTLGAVQNRLSSTVNNLSSIAENSTSARSQIRDTDFTIETANLTKNQILQQAGTSILAQANQLPQAALSLLG